MLIKAICKECCNRREGHLAKGDTDSTWNGWMESDDNNWRKSFVYCRFDERGIRSSNNTPSYAISTKGSPPSWCPYSAEHLVSQK